jgi:hypothetical protein
MKERLQFFPITAYAFIMFGVEIETIIEKVSLEVEDMMRFMNLKFTLF